MNSVPKVEDIKRSLKIGETYLVPCLIIRDSKGEISAFTPVINNPHNDVENGQPEVHYHMDYRFIKTEHKDDIIDDRPGFKSAKPRVRKGVNGELEWHILPVVSEDIGYGALFAIRYSTFKHKCIHKGKCPHRGYDLSQVTPVDGLIRCPMHGLEFYAKTGEITKETFDTLQKRRNQEKSHKERMRNVLLRINSIQNGEITKSEYDILSNNDMFSMTTYPPKDGYMECMWQQTHTEDYWPKKRVDGGKINFKVKL
jgi:hypothetical protein